MYRLRTPDVKITDAILEIKNGTNVRVDTAKRNAVDIVFDAIVEDARQHYCNVTTAACHPDVLTVEIESLHDSDTVLMINVAISGVETVRKLYLLHCGGRFRQRVRDRVEGTHKADLTRQPLTLTNLRDLYWMIFDHVATCSVAYMYFKRQNEWVPLEVVRSDSGSNVPASCAWLHDFISSQVPDELLDLKSESFENLCSMVVTVNPQKSCQSRDT